MYSIAAMCSLQNWEFEYICKTIPKDLKLNPSGNFKAALRFGMQYIELPPELYQQKISSLSSSNANIIIAQGGADKVAYYGIQKLAQEISASMSTYSTNKLSIITPSGTGTTALFLSILLPQFEIITTPTVGSTEYLRAQMSNLRDIPKNLTILEPAKKYRFATPHKDLLECYGDLKKCGIEFDLIYAPVMWLTLLKYIDRFDHDLLYVHSGGTSGNETMLERYRAKGLTL